MVATPADTLEDCAQLVKANSIQGHKINNVDVVYTPWSNLKKTPSMEVGQVHRCKAESQPLTPNLLKSARYAAKGTTGISCGKRHYDTYGTPLRHLPRGPLVGGITNWSLHGCLSAANAQ
jgi:NFACT protein RNA binding domain